MRLWLNGIAVALSGLAWSALAMAQAVPLQPEYRLSDEQKAAIRANTTAQGQTATPTAINLDPPAAPPQIHGEVGFDVGTGGYHSVYGTAVYPWSNGVAAISLSTSQFGDYYHHGH